MDLMSTCTELSGATYPATYKGYPIVPTTGVSLVPSFGGPGSGNGGRAFGHEMLFNEHFGARYAREGDWKIVSLARDSAWRLFCVPVDGSEMVDLAAKYPEKVRHLDSLWHQWANTHNVYPKPGKRK
jgi:arylsulfatase